jgi:hypothetical protein
MVVAVSGMWVGGISISFPAVTGSSQIRDVL